ncbi:TPA: HTH-like domain-containing protein, partial [Escherichia coli]
MTETQIYENIKQAISSAPRNSQTMEMHLQMIKYADHLKKVTAKEFCEGLDFVGQK